MINIKDFYDCFYDLGIEFFVGLPNETLLSFPRYINYSTAVHYRSKSDNNVGYRKNNIQIQYASSGGNALAIANGYALSTDKCPLVYCGDNVIGNVIDSAFSLYELNNLNVPMLILVGVSEKSIASNLVASYTKNFCTINSKTQDFEKNISDAYNKTTAERKPYFILLEANVLSNSKIENKKYGGLTEEEVISFLLQFVQDKDFIISSSDNVSNLIFEYNNKIAKDNILTLSKSNGLASSIALGITNNSNKNVYCIDEDGAFLLNTGGAITAIQNTQRNLKYILLEDGFNECADLQETSIKSLDYKKMLKSMGFKNIVEAYTYDDIKVGMLRLAKEKSALIIKTAPNTTLKDYKHFNNNTKSIFDKINE